MLSLEFTSPKSNIDTKKNDALKKVDPPGKYGQVGYLYVKLVEFQGGRLVLLFSFFFVRFSYLLNGVDLIFVQVELRR